MLTKNSLLMSNNSLIHHLLVAINKVSQQKKSILIIGQKGTEKELLAKTAHDLSPGSRLPFIKVQCVQFEEKTLREELFGSEDNSKVGKLDLLRGGTLYLEDIEKVSHIIQQEFVDRMNKAQEKGIFFRVIGSTSLDEESVRRAIFAPLLNLFYSEIFRVPTLSERKEDIPVLVKSYTDRFNYLTGHCVEVPEDEAMKALMTYGWPGNISELENLIEQLIITKEKGVIKLEDLTRNVTREYIEAHSQGTGAVSGWDFPKMALPESGLNLKEIVAAFENYLVDQALTRTKGNKNKASALLKMNRTTLVEKLRKRGMITPLKGKKADEEVRPINPFR